MTTSSTAIKKNIDTANTILKNYNRYYKLSESELDNNITFPVFIEKIINSLEYSLDGTAKNTAIYKRVNHQLNEYKQLLTIINLDRSSYEFTKKYYDIKTALYKVSVIIVNITIDYGVQVGIVPEH